MKFDQAVLHIGPNKTGSTVIPRVCDRSRLIRQEVWSLILTGEWHRQFAL